MTYAILFYAAALVCIGLAWIAACQWMLLHRYETVLDSLESRCSVLEQRNASLATTNADLCVQVAAQERELTYRRQRQCSLVRQMLDAERETLRLRMTYEPPARVIVDLPAHITHNPSDWGLN